MGRGPSAVASKARVAARKQLAVAKKTVGAVDFARSSEVREVIHHANPIMFLVAVMQGEPIGVDGKPDPDGEVLPLSERVDVAKFLVNKQVGNAAAYKPEGGEADDVDAAKWAKVMAAESVKLGLEDAEPAED